MDVTDVAVLSGIAPSPAEAVVQHFEALSRLQVPHDLGPFRGAGPERRFR